jgi:hypothetical protein
MKERPLAKKRNSALNVENTRKWNLLSDPPVGAYNCWHLDLSILTFRIVKQ